MQALTSTTWGKCCWDTHPPVVSRGDPFLKSVFFVGGCCIPSEKIVDSHPQRQKDPVISHFIQRRSSHLLTGGASRKYSFYSPSVRIPFSAHETLQTLLRKEKKIQHPRIIRARHRHAGISMLVSLVISASQVWVPFFPNPPRTGWGWGDRSQIPPLSLPSTAGKKYGASCCVQCRLINFVSCALLNHKSFRCVQAR